MRSRAFLLVLAAGALLASGCGSDKLAPVKGRVTCNGKPVVQAFVTFSPVPANEEDKEAGKPGTGETDEEGYYELSTYKNYDGALIGKHRVTVMLFDTNPARCKRERQFQLEVAPGANQHDLELNK